MMYPYLRFHSPKKLIILFVFLSVNVFPQTGILTPDIEKDIIKGLDATFKFDFEKSDNIFDRFIASYPEAAFGYHFKSIHYLWKFLDNKNDSDLTRFFALSDSVIEYAYNILSAEKDDAYTYYILGATYSFRTMAFTRLEKYMDVVFSAKESSANLEAAINLDSTFYDAYMGTGLFNFMIAQTPPALRWAMRISGMSGNKDKGLEYLRLAAENGEQSKAEAQYYLSQILVEFYGEFEEAELILKNLIKKYPKNLLFNYSLANFYINRARISDAGKILKKINSYKDTSFKQLIRYSDLLSTDILFFKNDFSSAIPVYESFMADSSETHFRGITAFRLGLSYSFLNDTLNAKKYFNKCNEGNSDIDDDRFAELMGSRFLENHPDSNRLKLYFIQNLIAAGSDKEALDSLLAFPKVHISSSLLAEKNLLLSKVYFELKDFRDSYSYAMSLVRNESAEKWVQAYSYYYAAYSSLKLNYFEDAQSFINKIKEYSDYPYENKLSNLIHALEYKLKELTKPAGEH